MHPERGGQRRVMCSTIYVLDLIAHSLVLTTGALRNKLHITLATPAGLCCTA